MIVRRMVHWILRNVLGDARYKRIQKQALAQAYEKAIASRLPAERPVPSVLIDDEEDDDGVIRGGSVKPGDPPQVYVTPYGVVTNSAEGITLHALDGSVMTMHPDGSSETRNPAIKRIAIHDMQQVVSMRSARVYDTVSHTIDFLGGGTLAYVADMQGKLLEVLVRGMACATVTAMGVMTVYRTGEMLPEDREEAPR